MEAGGSGRKKGTLQMNQRTQKYDVLRFCFFHFFFSRETVSHQTCLWNKNREALDRERELESEQNTGGFGRGRIRPRKKTGANWEEE